MSKKKNILNIIIIIGLIQLFTSLITQEIEPKQLPIDYSGTIEINEENNFNKYFFIQYKEDDLKDNNYLIISTFNSIYDKNAFIYISFNEKNPSPDKRDYASQYLEKNEVIINTLKLKGKNKLYLNLHSLVETTVNLNISLTKEIELSLDDNKKRFKLSDVNKVIYKNNEIKKLMFYSYGENINYFSMKIKSQSKEYISQQKFYNGYGIIIDLDNTNDNIYEITLIPNEAYPGIDSKEKEAEVGFQFPDNDTINNINILQHVYGYSSSSESCYKINELNTNFNTTIILINSYSQPLNFILQTEPEYSIDIFNNYYIKLPTEYFNNNIFCFKHYTNKEKDVENKGDISYDFQIIYEEDLANIQSFIFPLRNGIIYTHSLKSQEIMIYRHNSYNKYNFLYSVSMTVLRGKPVLYGYECDTYPECNLDKDKFDLMKKKGKIELINNVNNYYINKKLNAQGNKEINGENMSQSRKQYLSVVLCESTEDYPNKGECQYTIEINNYNDEIELIPDKVFTDSILFDKNYFRINLPNYNELNYIKIFFTILSGNANIEIYSDNSYKNKITKFSYRHVHRKEIIEITENILSNYYIIITNEDSAFIEIKYETDFEYKGYNKLNPNEVNIEYLNKELGFIPYGIINPNYFYPIDNPNNNDFYFDIRPLDCSITYKYNFIDEYNLTNKYHEVKKNDINFGSSYGFELKLENYFHTIIDNKEDCTIIISTGEKNQNKPLLIFEDFFHPSNFRDIYYIYPFSITDNFKGILIQVQLDKESITQINYLPKIQIKFKIGKQTSDYETYIISKDSAFFISEKKIKKFCDTKLYLCSLVIEINKQEEQDYSYTILTNVHSSYDSVEYILENKVYNYYLCSNDYKYFYTQINKDELCEVNFIFNSGNGKVYAKLVEKNITEINPNWNRRVKLPLPDSNDLIYYDALNSLLKYDSIDYNNCNNGCELYFLIESNEDFHKENSLTEVNFYINKKIKEKTEVKNSVIEINDLNKYIKGTLEKNKYKYYTITIPYDYYKISFNLYSQNGKAYIKLGKGHICDKNSSLWELIPLNNNFARIIIEANDVSINKTSLKDISFSIGITNNEEISDNSDLEFYLQIQGLYNNNKNYYLINNDRSITCDTEDDIFCHVLLYVNSNNNNNKNLLYTKGNNNIKIYAKYYSEINETNYHNSIENLFPTKLNYDIESKDNYIFLNSKKYVDKKNDLYILLTIYSNEKNSQIKIISNNVDTGKTLLNYGTENLYYFVRDIKFHLPYDQNNINYLMNILTIKGTQEFAIKDGETISDLNGNYYINIKPNLSGKTFDINNINKDIAEQGIILNYFKSEKNNIFFLEKNIKNEIFSSINSEAVLPQYSYTKLNYNISLKIEILFHDITYQQNLKKNEDNFSIKAYIINKDTLIKIKRNPEIKEEGEEIVGNYLKYEKTGLIEVLKDKIKDNDEYYLYMVINKEKDNENIYSTIKFQYAVNEEENGMQIFQNNFYYSNINNPNKEDIYTIYRQSNNDKYVIIDIAENIPVLNSFKIRKELFKDNKNIINGDSIIYELDYNGRKRIIADLESFDGIKLFITKNNEQVIDKYYSINYNLVNNLSNFENFTNFNDTLFISTKKDNKEKTNLIFNSILRYKRFFSIKSFNCYLDIFEPNNEIQNKSNIYSTYIGNHDEKNIIYSTILNDNRNFFSRNITIELNMTKEILKKYFIRLLVDLFNNDGTRQKYIYNMTLIDIDIPENSDNTDDKKSNEDSDMALYIIIFIPTLCVIMVIVVFIYVKNKSKEKEIDKTDEVESGSLLPNDTIYN